LHSSRSSAERRGAAELLAFSSSRLAVLAPSEFLRSERILLCYLPKCCGAEDPRVSHAFARLPIRGGFSGP
jgi:hypothetical protein